jgi:hypothetical protein
MRFMVELRLEPGSKPQVLEAFEQRGPGRCPGVTFRQAWVSAQSDVVFALVDGADEAVVAAAARSWNEAGESKITAVHDIEQV